MTTDDSFKFDLLLACLRITCHYFKGDEDVCGISDVYEAEEGEDYCCHVTCNCDGNIKRCDLPEKFQMYL